MNTKENKKEQKSENKTLTPQQIQRRRNFVVYPLMFLVFFGTIWFIFAPSDSEEILGENGFNMDIPLPKEDAIFSDKKTAYEQEAFLSKQQEKKRSLQDFAFSLGDDSNQVDEIPSLTETSSYQSTPPAYKKTQNSIQASTAAYQDINRQLVNFYDQPATEIDEQSQLELQWRVQELERKVEDAELRKKVEDEQLAILEKSYELAAKYMPNNQENINSYQQNNSYSSGTSTDKIIPKPINRITQNVVSMLSAPLTDEEFIEEYSRPRNMGFHTAAGSNSSIDKNTISATVYQTVVLTDGKEIQFRLTEPLQAGNLIIPTNTIVTGTAKIGGERMDVTISAIEYAGNVIPVSMQVYDTQGMPGLFIPGSDELNALKEVAANMGSNLNSTINISQQNAGQQLATDLGRGMIQGTSQYIAKKMRTIKVTVKAGHQIYLMPKQ